MTCESCGEPLDGRVVRHRHFRCNLREWRAQQPHVRHKSAEALENDRAASRRWKEQNRARNRARDRAYLARKKAES